MPRAVKIVCFALAVAGLGVLAASCGNGNAQYRVVNAISNTSTLDPSGLAIYMNGGSVFTSVTFGQTEPSSAGKYQNQQGGTDTIDVYQEKSAGAAGAQIIEAALNLGGNTQNTVVLTGNQSTAPAVYKYVDNNTTLPISGNALFRIINASAVSNEQNGVDVYVLQKGTYPNSPNAPKINTSGALTFGNATPYVNVGLPPGNSLNVYVTPHGQYGYYAQPIAVSGLTGETSIRTIVIMDSSPGVAPLKSVVLTDVN